ncbi:MAG: 30S ribosome-binding factor RbfA [Candidatus Bipolaricaulota bacterium]
MSTRKNARLREDIQRELSAILEFESRDPVVRNAFPTLMDVRLSVDARYARVYVAVAGDVDREAVERSLSRDRGFYRSMLAERLSLRHTPEIRFVLDESVERALRLHELLADDIAETDANATGKDDV